jgi:DNA helicase HerA-like ATPase
LLDAHNEYARCFGDGALVLNPSNLKLPFWLFNLDEMIGVIFGDRAASDDEIEILDELIPLAKAFYAQHADRLTLRRADSKSTGYTSDTPVPFRLQDLIFLINQKMGKLENRSSRMSYFRLIARIEAVSNDARYAFMFENANVGGDTMADTLCHLFRWKPNGKPVTIMQLAGFPAEVVDAVVSVLGRLAFDFGVWSDGAIQLLFVCEEAHRYVSADPSLGFLPTRRAISRIAKEGGKHGLFLGLVTQRPAELDPTIASQCSTLFAMRMANDRDQAFVRTAVSDAAANLLRFLPSLGTGEVIAFGAGVALPTRFIFPQLPEHLIARIELLGSGRLRAGPDDSVVDSAISRWRGALGNKQKMEERTA